MKKPARGGAYSLLLGITLILCWLAISSPLDLDPGPPASGAEESLRSNETLRADTMDFGVYRERIVIGRPEVTIAARADGAHFLDLSATVRNDTGRVINRLEMRGAVYDTRGSLVNERMAVIIPTQQTAIEPNEVIKAHISLADVGPEAARANFRMEVVGALFD
jgi:hypothetical protein